MKRNDFCKIDAAGEEDLPGILEIERESISPQWTHGAILREIYCDDSFFALARKDNEILGFVILRRTADEGDLLQIAVGVKHRRCGIADILMQALLDNAKESALLAVYLEVRKGNKAAIALYKKHGFKQLGHRKDYFTEPVEDAMVMVRGLWLGGRGLPGSGENEEC